LSADSTEALARQAESGDAEAQFKLAQVYNYGLGAPIDDEAAIGWYRRSAEQKFERAQFTLGEICKQGRITPQDLVQSHVWYSLVAGAGGALAPAGAEGCAEIEPYMSADQIAEAKRRVADGTSDPNIVVTA
jgi:TPR repeat protein